MDNQENTTTNQARESEGPPGQAGPSCTNAEGPEQLDKQAEKKPGEETPAQKARAGRVIIRNLQFGVSQT